MNADTIREFESLLRMRPHRERASWRKMFKRDPERTLALLQAAP